ALTKILADLNQGDDNGAGIGPLIAQNRTYVRYEIRMNKAEFDAIKTNQLYLRAKLPPQDPNGATAPLLPNGAIDVKAAWREVRDGENTDRYYQTEGLAIDPATGRCDKRRFVLIGFHVPQKTPQRPQWIWSTFEHVDNISAPAGVRASLNDPTKPQTLGSNPGLVDAANPPKPDPDPVQVVFQNPANNPRPETQVTNTKWRPAPQLQASVWRFYQLIKTQWPTDPTAGITGAPFEATRVANLTMETFRQRLTCIGCHAQATHRTDFVWFLSNRAFPVDDSVLSNGKIIRDLAVRPPL